ncbi:MAG: hypothetical protein A2X86_14710 [Bdellovibrionales bacterium GWA2_49_15]|nr:MAG: hypothetical protein A2X86_14710 [Bdellovibrionales bacterium GWA2_49_15]HAZ13408.1 hypothetical protein [Bdellovibrionales bacterium]
MKAKPSGHRDLDIFENKNNLKSQTFQQAEGPSSWKNSASRNGHFFRGQNKFANFSRRSALSF